MPYAAFAAAPLEAPKCTPPDTSCESRIDASPPRLRASALERLIVTDTIPLPPEKRDPRIEVVSVAPLLSAAIGRIHRGESLYDMASRR